MATILNVATHLLQRAPAQRVYLRRRWGVEWAWQPHLYCRRARQAIQPAGASAELHWMFGLIQHPGDQTPQVYPPLEILGWFVKVEFDVTDAAGAVTTHTHYGVVVDEDRERRGDQRVADAWVPSGQQAILTQGLDYLYRRQRIDRARVEKLDLSLAEVRRGLTFNAENPVSSSHGNRSVGLGGDGHYLFTEDLANGRFWSTNNIVNYLHRVFRPLGSNDFDLMDWQLDAPHLTILSSDDRPRLEAHGRTLGDLFDELMNRRRGLGWTVFVDDDDQFPFIRPLSLASTPVDMPDGWTLEPARNQYALHSDRAVQQLAPIVKRSLAAQYDQVRAVGERIRSVFSISKPDSTLDQDWAASQRSEYNAGASGLGDYPADTDQREAANTQVRARPNLERVFACFKLPANLSFVGDGVGGALEPWLPDETGTTYERTYRPELRILPYLPIAEQAVAGEATQPMRLLALVRVKEGDTDKYVPIDRLGQLAKVEELGDGNGFKWSAHVRPAEHDAAIWIHTAGKPQHVLAANAGLDFSPLGDGSDDREPPELDWREDLLCTVCVEAQRQVEAVWPASVTITDRDSVRRLVIEVGAAARLDYLAPGTVLGLDDDGKLVHQTGGIYLRDDRQKLRTLARQAFIWYQRVRQAVILPFAGTYTGLREGDYLTEVGSADTAEPIEAVVSSVEYDFQDGRTTIQTDYAELDFRQVI
jgi:hypothetical protein